jgi:hypothetical protein
MATISGAQGKIDAMQQATGIRDAGLQSIIDTLIEMGKQLRKVQPGETRKPEVEVQKQLHEELDKLLLHRPAEDWINPLLGMRGTVSFSWLCYSN